MVNDNISFSFLIRLFNRTGKWYPLLVLLFLQVANTPLLLLLTAMPAQDNAMFSMHQGISLLVFGGIAVVLRNVFLLLQFTYFNRELFSRLDEFCQNGPIDPSPEREKRAWEQASAASKHYGFAEFVELFLLVLFPALVYGYYFLKISPAQMIYLSLATASAGLVILILQNIFIDQLFEPVLHTLQPRKYESQLAGLKGLRLWAKLSIAIMGLVMIGLLLTVPTAYQQVNLMFLDAVHSPESVRNALMLIVKASIGAIVVGGFLSFRLVSYLSIPFQRMIELFRDVESGNLDRRMDVVSADEFGELNIHINRMIGRLQVLTASLEQQVAERTEQLIVANRQLQIELEQRKRMEEQLAYSALHDALTGLPNRVLFMDRLKHAMERSRRHQKILFSVIFIDLDRFKVVNDSQGHNVGDLLLIESSRRLQSCLRSEDTIARMGGDEFVILLEELDVPADCIRVIDRIQKELVKPADLAGNKVFISVSMGIVFNHAGYEKPEDILRDADIAMYHAKRKGRGRYEIFDPAMLDRVRTRMELEAGLRNALKNQEFVLHYQPIYEMGSRHIIGFEALVRWQHPERGLLLPAEFIPTAEETGLIVSIGYWVLDEACRQMRQWQDQYPAETPLMMNVNISTRQCVEIDFIQKIADILEKNHLEPRCLALELTESLVIEDSEFTSNMLAKLRDLGIQVQIDDFGTGFSSLGYLHDLPIDTLKIDRTFIQRLGENGGAVEIVNTILALAHGLGMKVVAEGVETEAQFDVLKTMNCEFVQGFLFARPVESCEAGAMLGESL